MSKAKNITGMKFGNLTALCQTNERKNGSIVWQFTCDCGNIVKKPYRDVVSGKTNSCGCMRGKHKVVEETVAGKKFGRLTALHPTDQRVNGHVMWRFKCDCGNIIEQRLIDVKRGNTKSCGCLLEDYRTNRKIDISSQQFGFLTAVCPTEKTSRGCVVWRFRCICGNEIEKSATLVKSGHVKSCGCIRFSGLKNYR